ncbi:amine-terminal domain cyclin (macronuclear) [Tetrahymena thermophila SB210]|uniref:Amine-terminal domain cyclin n=1 Tax=Tetrahymena thermophila (strain SB210) TaxID=312017 RepID=I7LZR5_TETTS|nr:amine-terminal domain cyclin [Tetrahymena thermophila SB210]EAR84676.2 amine-terminal domain cyclin [Tetrahymena thermophila SB210]|eukprot:XP_001032339.2 amine-terminal domain cyclin [Tetrahymena thermophila SB210]
MENKNQTNQNNSSFQSNDLTTLIKQDYEIRNQYCTFSNGLQQNLLYAREKILYWVLDVMEKIELSLRSIEIFVFIFELHWVKNQNSIPKQELQKLALSSLYLVIKEIENEEITVDYLNYMCKNAYSNEEIETQIKDQMNSLPNLNFIITPSILLPAFKIQIDEEDYKTASLFVYQTYDNIISLNSSEILFITLKFIQTSPLINSKYEDENIKAIIKLLAPFISSSLEQLEQIVKEINEFVEQHDDNLSEDFNFPNGSSQDIKIRKMSLECDLSMNQQKQFDGESQILNNISDNSFQDNDHNISIEQEIKSNRANSKHLDQDIQNNKDNDFLLNIFVDKNEKNKQEEMEKPQSCSDCFYFHKSNCNFDSGIFSSFAQLNDLELKGDTISNVSTCTPINSNYNSNNLYNSNNTHFNSLNTQNNMNNSGQLHQASYHSHIQSPNLTSLRSNNKNINNQHFNTNFSSSDNSFAKCMTNSLNKQKQPDDILQSQQNLNSISTRLTLDEEQQIE